MSRHGWRRRDGAAGSVVRAACLGAVARALLAWTLLQGAHASTHASTPAETNQAPGLLTDAAPIPIGVWLQSPNNAPRYRAAGINLYVGLWRGPTEDQLARLRAAGMRVICEQNATALGHLSDPVIAGWMHGDEPDNAQSRGRGQGYGPPITPETIVADYQRMRWRDPSRPILLNLGQGVAWDDWIGRGVRRHHPEDYPEYLKGCDIASFDIYPVVHDNRQVAGRLEYVGLGVQRLLQWSGGRKPVWACLECTHISNPNAKPTPAQVRTEAWMALIHGARGLVYFVHEFQPRFNEAALLADAPMLAAVTRLNQQIAEAAPILRSPTLESGVSVSPTNPAARIDLLAKRLAGHTYVFAVGMSPAATRATFTVAGPRAADAVEVLDEGRTLPAQNGRFTDDFAPYAVHRYRLP